jgi:hypothetical protein
MSSGWNGDERRDHPRFAVRANTAGTPEPTWEIPVLDLSLSGALLEVSSGLPRKNRYLVRLPLPAGEALQLQGDVVRSYVHGFDKDSSGRPAVKYRVAIRFIDMSAAERKRLEEFLGQSGTLNLLNRR